MNEVDLSYLMRKYKDGIYLRELVYHIKHQLKTLSINDEDSDNFDYHFNTLVEELSFIQEEEDECFMMCRYNNWLKLFLEWGKDNNTNIKLG